MSEASHKPKIIVEHGKVSSIPCKAHHEGFWLLFRPIHQNQIPVRPEIIQGAIITIAYLLANLACVNTGNCISLLCTE